MMSSHSNVSVFRGPNTVVDTQQLDCVLCHKKTGEHVVKMCHACGSPLHLSCAQLVATRDCNLEYGFPLPTVHCSKRCYDADFLVSQTAAESVEVTGFSVDDEESGGSNHLDNGTDPKQWSTHSPDECTAVLTLKVGDVSKTSRKHLTISSFQFLLTEGYAVFKAKVNNRAVKELQCHTGEPHFREDPAIYIRPGVHSKQAELVELTEKNFESRIRKTYRNFLKRKATQVPNRTNERFECDIYIYVKKETSARRRTSGKGADGNIPQLQPQAVTAYPEGFGSWPMPSPMTVPSGNMNMLAGGKRKLHQLGVSDSGMVNTVGTGVSPESMSAYKSIRMILNGTVIAVKINVYDLLGALGADLSGGGVPEPTEHQHADT